MELIRLHVESVEIEAMCHSPTFITEKNNTQHGPVLICALYKHSNTQPCMWNENMQKVTRSSSCSQQVLGYLNGTLSADKLVIKSWNGVYVTLLRN